METSALMHESVARFEIPETRASQYGRNLRSDIRHALQHGDRHLVVDCEAWNELDLSTLSSLIQCASACRAQGASFEVTNMSSNIRAAVHALHLTDRLGLID
jgi:anti-anti-sigma regulatory factor